MDKDYKEIWDELRQLRNVSDELRNLNSAVVSLQKQHNEYVQVLTSIKSMLDERCVNRMEVCRKNLSDLKESIKGADYDGRIKKLETWYWKLIGAGAAIGALTGFVMSLALLLIYGLN